jgi:hypothetical protein
LDDLPKGAHAGECFAHANRPAVWRTFHIPVPQPPLERWRDIPAVYKTVTHQVEISPARVDHTTVPAVMGTRVHWTQHAGADRLVQAPAVYRWEARRVQVSPARLEWRRSAAAEGYVAGEATQSQAGAVQVRATGEVMCRVLVPARFDVRRVRVLVTPARTCIVKGASTRERVVEPYEASPAREIDHPVAAVYKTVKERVLVSAARRERIETPRLPHYIDKRVLVTPAQTGWTRMHCAPPRLAPRPVLGASGAHASGS